MFEKEYENGRENGKENGKDQQEQKISSSPIDPPHPRKTQRP